MRRIDHIERADTDVDTNGSSQALAVRSMVRVDAEDLGGDGNGNADAARVVTLRDTIRSYDNEAAAASQRGGGGFDEGPKSSDKGKKSRAAVVETLEEDTMESHWLVVKRRVSVMPGIERGGATETVLGIAFEAISHGKENKSGVVNASSAELPVFAFLPIAPAGFRFVLHADWILSSSRETVLRDSLSANPSPNSNLSPDPYPSPYRNLI